jgi:hypothetical protein
MAAMPRRLRLSAEWTMRSGIPRPSGRPRAPTSSQLLVNRQQAIDFSLQNFYFLIKIGLVYADTTNEG